MPATSADLPSLEESRMGRLEAEADRAITMPGIDLIEGMGDTLTFGQLGRCQRHEKISTPIMQHPHISELHTETNDRARSCAAPKAHPQGAGEAEGRSRYPASESS